MPISIFKGRGEKQKLKRIAEFLLQASTEQLELTGGRYGILILDRKYGFIVENTSKIEDLNVSRLMRKLASVYSKFNGRVEGTVKVSGFNIIFESTRYFILMIASDVEEEDKFLAAKLNIASLIDVVESQSLDDILREIEQAYQYSPESYGHESGEKEESTTYSTS